MIRYRIASRLGLVEPLVRMQRAADAGALSSARRRERGRSLALRRA